MIIYKYPVAFSDVVGLMLPRLARPISVGFQGKELMMWVAIPDLTEKLQLRKFIALPTGVGSEEYKDKLESKDLISTGDFVGTATLATPGHPLFENGIVAHVFEVDHV